jgi:hypothetical protein
MKKFLIVFCLCLAIVSVALVGDGWAVSPGIHKQGGRAAPVFQRYIPGNIHTIDNNAGGYLKTNVAITTLIPATHNIIGYTVMSLTGHVVDGSLVTGHSENVASIWDAISGTTAPVMILPEIEAVDESFDGWMALRPKPFTYGVTVHQGSYTRVQIIYE